MAEASPERVIFSSAIEAFYARALKGRVTPQLKAGLRGIGIDLDRPLHPAYPWAAWVRGIELTAALLHPTLSRSAAFHELGTQIIVSYQETLVGKALFAALRIFSPRRIVDRMTRNFRTTNNFTEVSVTDVGPSTVDLHFNVVESDPAFTQGVLAAGFPAANIKTATVTLQSFDGERAVYRVTW